MNHPDDLPDFEPQPPLQKILIEIARATVDAVEDDDLTRLLAVYHEEWERRHGERWVLAESQ
jgi:hypothetical protein